MKTCFFILLFVISTMGFAQNNYIVKTDDGRRVLLKADYTWEYIDTESPETNHVAKEITKSTDDEGCSVSDDFVEPKLDNKIQSQLKKGRATIDHIKKKVAKDYDCNLEDVLLLSASEKKSTGIYHFCANGTKVTYKRNGHAILKSGKFF